MTQFVKAERKRAKLRMALTGVSGSGKTFSALRIARGLVGEEGKIALVDTESGSGELYGSQFKYDYARIVPPFHPQKYIDSISSAEDADYDLLIIDSASHAWSGTGGLLDLKERLDEGKKNIFAAWKEVNPIHNAFVDRILGSEMHILLTLRTKIAYEAISDDGRMQVKRVGLAPIQREGFEYEMTVVFMLDPETHIAFATKDRTSLFQDVQFVPSEETGEMLRDWLESGADPVEISRLSKEKLLSEVITVEQDYDTLVKWYTNNQSTISMLTPSDREEIVSQLKALKGE